MGANLETVIYPFEDPKGLLPWWEDRQYEDRRRNGDDTYSGSIGSLLGGVDLVKRQPFPSMDGATSFLEEHHEKGEPAMAVPFIGKVEVPFVTLAAALRKRTQAEERLAKLIETTLDAMKRTKSKTIGCKRCGSAIARSYLMFGREWPGEVVHHNSHGDDIICPVCFNDLTTPSDRKRIEAARTAVCKAANECHLLRDRKDVRKGTNWLVGGLCRS